MINWKVRFNLKKQNIFIASSIRTSFANSRIF